LDELQKIASDLMALDLMRPRADQGQRAYGASCLIDILRIFAPNAPYTMEQLEVSNRKVAAYSAILTAENILLLHRRDAQNGKRR
jgi:hypothetical protein